jgi:hypothetical protein
MRTNATLRTRRLCMEKLESREVCSATPLGCALATPPAARLIARPAAMIAPAPLQDVAGMTAAAPTAAPRAACPIVGTWKSAWREGWYRTVSQTVTFYANGYGVATNVSNNMGYPITQTMQFRWSYQNANPGQASLWVAMANIGNWQQDLVVWHGASEFTLYANGTSHEYYRQ